MPGLRFVVAAPEGRDDELICGLLEQSGYSCDTIQSVASIRQMEMAGMLGLVLTDEALANGRLDLLAAILADQPAWSELPVILLTGAGTDQATPDLGSRARLAIRGLVLLDRPVRKELLLTVIEAAFHSRLQQLEVRDARIRQLQSDEALRQTEKLAVAGRLATTIVHEVNNPLEAINNLLYLINQSEGLEEVQELSRAAMQEIRRVGEIVRHTLHLNRAMSECACVDLADLACSAIALFRGKLKQRRITEELDVRETLAMCVPGEMRQVLVNLISNAIDALPHGGRLRIRVAPLCIAGASFARLIVADTGIGISNDIRSRLFTQFFTTKGSQGTGIGLWLTRDIIMRNHGRLSFRSRATPPTGTVFYVRLPLHDGSSVVPQNNAQSDDQSGSWR